MVVGSGRTDGAALSRGRLVCQLSVAVSSVAVGEAGGSAQGRGTYLLARVLAGSGVAPDGVVAELLAPGGSPDRGDSSPSEDGAAGRAARLAGDASLADGGAVAGGDDSPRCATSCGCPPGPGAPRIGRTGCPPPVRDTLVDRGVRAPWTHQVWPPSWPTPGSDVVVATGTASGKSLAYQLPVLTALAADAAGHRPLPLADQGAGRRPARAPSPSSTSRTCGRPPSTATPRSTSATGPAGTPAGSSPTRTCCTARCCPGTPAGRRSCAGCATSSSTSATPTAGVFGSHVALVLRRLLRVCARYGADADVRARLGHRGRPGGVRLAADRAPGRRGDRGRLAERGPDLRALGAAAAARARRRERRTRCGGLRARRRPACWPTWSWRGPARWRSCGRAAAPSVAALSAQRLLADVDPELVGAGRRLPRRLPARGAAGAGGGAGRPATCSAWPRPTPWSWAWTSPAWTPWWWPASRARGPRSGSRRAAPGRARDEALVVLVARDDPLDTYLVHHPEALLGAPGGGMRARPRQPLRAGPAAGVRRRRAAADRGRPRRRVRRDRRRAGARRAGGRRGAAAPPRRVVLALDPGAPGGHRGHPRIRARTGGRGRGGHRADARHGRRGVGARHRARRRGLPAPRRELPGGGPRSRRRGRAGARRRPRTGAPTPARRPTSRCPQCSPAASAARCGWRSAR